MSPSDTVCTEEILTGPNNYEIWKVRISAKLQARKVFAVVSGTDIRPVPSTLVTASDILEWQHRDEKAHGIIQLRISDALVDLHAHKRMWSQKEQIFPAYLTMQILRHHRDK